MTFQDFLNLFTVGNILFLVIYSIATIIIFTIVISSVISLIKLVIRVFKIIFRIKNKKNNFIDEGGNIEVVVKDLEESEKETSIVEDKKPATATTASPVVQYTDKAKDKKEVQVDKEQSWQKKEQEDISSSLDKLKGKEQEDKENGIKLGSTIKTAGAKKHNNGEENTTDDARVRDNFVTAEKLEVPVPKRHSKPGLAAQTSPSQSRKQSVDYENIEQINQNNSNNSDDRLDRLDITENSHLSGAKIGNLKNILRGNGEDGSETVYKDNVNVDSTNGQSKDQIPVYKKPEFVEDTLTPHSAHKREASKQNSLTETLMAGESKKIGNSANPGSKSVFEVKGGISKLKLKSALRGKKGFEAQYGTGFQKSPVERAKEVDKLFSSFSHYGTNITKDEFKYRVKQLKRQSLSAKTAQERTALRKEVKFWQKFAK